MTLNAAGDLRRFAWKDSAYALCREPSCPFAVHGLSSERTGAKARRHTRESGHRTTVYHRHVTEYRAPEATP